MANGKYYDSKSEFRKATKAAGCIEVGDDKSVMQAAPRTKIETTREDRQIRREHIRQALHEHKNGRR